MRGTFTTGLLLPSLLLGACAGGLDQPDDYVKTDPGKGDSSAVATFLDFRFTGELVSDSDWGPERQVEDQLMYTMGLLNGDNSVGRLDRLALENVAVAPLEGTAGRYKISYVATLPVAWGSKTNLPTTYELRLPRDMSYAGQQAFSDKYNESCVDWGAHDVSPGNFWYYYRPAQSGCALADADVVKTTADVSRAASNTTGKYPEYDMVWADGALNVVAIFGKYEDGATGNGDAGISAYNTFVRSMKRDLADLGVQVTPAGVSDTPGTATPDVSFTATTADGKTIQVTALLVDNVQSTTAAFNTRYEGLSATADVIAYNGHAGLGANVRALARKGRFQAGQYVMVFMNGCDTFAYVDNALWAKMAELNPGDTTGTKHMDIITNAMPSYFSSMAGATGAIVRALIARDNPLTYERIFERIDSEQVVLVSGEEDNVFVPGGPATPAAPAWAGLTESGAIDAGAEKRYETPVLAAGSYELELTGTGDADLYVRVGLAPDTVDYDCRPFRSSANESCVVELNTAAAVHILVRGVADGTTYNLQGKTR